MTTRVRSSIYIPISRIICIYQTGPLCDICRPDQKKAYRRIFLFRWSRSNISVVSFIYFCVLAPFHPILSSLIHLPFFRNETHKYDSTQRPIQVATLYFPLKRRKRRRHDNYNRKQMTLRQNVCARTSRRFPFKVTFLPTFSFFIKNNYHGSLFYRGCNLTPGAILLRLESHNIIAGGFIKFWSWSLCS